MKKIAKLLMATVISVGICIIAYNKIPIVHKVINGFIYLAENGPYIEEDLALRTYGEQIKNLEENHPKIYFIYNIAIQEIDAGSSDAYITIRMILQRTSTYTDKLLDDIDRRREEAEEKMSIINYMNRLQFNPRHEMHSEFVRLDLRKYNLEDIIKLYSEKLLIGYNPERQYVYIPNAEPALPQWKLIRVSP